MVFKASEFPAAELDSQHNPGLTAHTGTAGTSNLVRTKSTPSGAIHIAPMGTYDIFAQDASTEGMIGIDYPHHEIHDGNHYFLSGFGTVAAAANLDFTIITPNTAEWAHMFWKVNTTLQTEAYVYEDSSLGTGGAALTPINSNRNSDNESGLTIKLGQVVGTAGDLLSSQSWGGTAVGGRNFGGEFGREDEMMLKQNGTYTVRLTSRANNNIISYYAFWYEHTDAN